MGHYRSETASLEEGEAYWREDKIWKARYANGYIHILISEVPYLKYQFCTYLVA